MLAPILEKALGQLSRDQDFFHLLDNAGLKLEDSYNYKLEVTKKKSFSLKDKKTGIKYR